MKNFLQIKSADEYRDFLRDFRKASAVDQKDIILAMKTWLNAIQEEERKRPVQEQTSKLRRPRRRSTRFAS